MKQLTFCALVLFFSSLSGVASAGKKTIDFLGDLNHRSGKLGVYKALIIGIDNYRDKKIPDLKTATKDAEAVAGILRDKYGFGVKLLLDHMATKRFIYQALRQLSADSKEDDSVLIYYAGHGGLDRKNNDGWWMPIDARGGNPLTYLDNTTVQKAIQGMKARHVLLISDSYFSGTLFGESPDLPSVIAKKHYLEQYNKKSRWGMTSGNKKPVSDAESGGHSIFAYRLLKELRENEQPYIALREISARIAPVIGNNSEQTPLCSPLRDTGDQGGEFVFVALRNIPKPGEWRDPVTGMEFVRVPAGCFEMGSPDTGNKNISLVQLMAQAGESPLHEVCVDGFWMGKYEVTNAQYRQYRPKYDSKEYKKGHSLNRDYQPVVFVSWEDAKDYIRWFNQKNNGKFKFRLPTEAEWEYAARAGTKTITFWGNRPEDACGYANVFDHTSLGEFPNSEWEVHNCDDGYAVSAPVGSFKPNAFGLFDMLGNVWEWCEDIYARDAYSKHQRNNPINKDPKSDRIFKGRGHVMRGGSWYYFPLNVRSARRAGGISNHTNRSMGFRLIRKQ